MLFLRCCPRSLLTLVAVAALARNGWCQPPEDLLPVRWEMGRTWSLRISCQATERTPPRKESWDCTVTVVDTPETVKGTYVLKMTVGARDETLFFLLRQGDLSLTEFRKDTASTEKAIPWQKARIVARYPGGVPVFVRSDFLRIAIPVITPDEEIRYVREHEYTIVQRFQRVTRQGLAAFQFSFARARNGATAKALLDDDRADYRILWPLKSNWWHSCVVRSEDQYRIDLVTQ